MFKYILLLSLMATICKAQTVINNQITIGTEEHLYSRVIKEDQTYWVSLPLNYNNPRFVKTRYPVIYVLDGDANFASVSTMMRQLSVRNGNSVFPEVIVVGVLNNKRSRDFTPYPSSFWLYNTPAPFQDAGGGENFANYLVNELVPHIDSLYATAPYKVLVGHSLGGLEATNLLINHKYAFNGFVIIDPSLWFDNQSFLKHAATVLHTEKYSNTTVYLGMANNLLPGMDTLQMLRDTQRKNLHMRSVFKFKQVMLQNHDNGIQFHYGYYGNDTHMSVPLIAEYNGFRYIFKFYQLPAADEAALFDPANHSDPAQLLSAHFSNVSHHLGYVLLPPEDLVNLFANTMVNYYLPARALTLYQLNTKNYPGSYGAWESLGDCYEKLARKADAVKCYRQALTLKDTDEVRQKLMKTEESR